MDENQRVALEQAIENFRPEQSLETPEAFEQFYVKRPLAFTSELRDHIKRATPDAKFLVYGHRGCGKTAELNRLAQELSDSHLTVFLSLEKENDPNDLHYTELLTSICRSLLYKAQESDIPVSEKLLKDVYEWFVMVEDITEKKLTAEAGSTQKLGIYFLELFAKQGAEFSQRQERRAKREQHAGALLALINRFIDEIRERDPQQRRLFAIVDSLDRYPPEVARSIFKYAQALRAPQMTIVYTVPLAMTQDTAAANLLQDFGNVDCTIPIITLMKFDQSRDEVAWTIMNEIVQRRCGDARLPHTVADLLIEGSGGVLSILCWLFYNVYSYLYDSAIALDDVETVQHVANRVLTQQRERFKQRLMEDDYQTLNQPLPSPFPKRDMRFQQLLYANCILQYSTDEGESWYDMHPLVAYLVERWQTTRSNTSNQHDGATTTDS